MTESRSFPRTTSPHIPSLADAIRAELGKANVGSFHVDYDGAKVIITQGGWTGVDLGVVQAAVTAAPDDTPQARAGDIISDIPLWEKAVFLVFLDMINTERAQHGRASITPAQFIALAKQKVDTL